MLPITRNALRVPSKQSNTPQVAGRAINGNIVVVDNGLATLPEILPFDMICQALIIN